MSKGGYSGRSVTSDTEYMTLFPKWPEIPGKLSYNGTWSQLQSEILVVQVFDRGLYEGLDKCIGWSRIPLGGRFRDDGESAEGQVSSGLGISKIERTEVSNRHDSLTVTLTLSLLGGL